MDFHKRILITLLLLGMMIETPQRVPSEIKVESGSKIPMKLNPWIQKTMIHGGTMSSVNDYMAINHAYRSKHSYDTSEAVSGLFIIANEVGAILVSNVEHTVDLITSILTQISHQMAEVVSDLAQASSSGVSESLLLMTDTLHLSEKVDYVIGVLTKAGYGEVNHSDMIPGLQAAFGVLIAQFFFNLQLDMKISVEFMKKVFRETILCLWQLYKFIEGSAGCSVFIMVEVPLISADVALIIVAAMILALVIFVVYQLTSDSHRYHYQLQPDCSACRELQTIMEVAEQADVQMSGLLKEVHQMTKTINEVKEEVDAMKDHNKQKQMDLISLIGQGDALIKHMQESDKDFCIQNGYETKIILENEEQVDVQMSGILKGVQQLTETINEVKEEVDAMKEHNKKNQMDLIDRLNQGSALIKQMQKYD